MREAGLTGEGREGKEGVIMKGERYPCVCVCVCEFLPTVS